MIIREATDEDWVSIWPIFKQIAEAGETYAYDTNTTEEQARYLWLDMPQKTYVCLRDGVVQGTYYIKANYPGPGDHVCNCGYMVSSTARGKGLASGMCVHSQGIAIELGYRAMQYNLVASSNVGAVHLWTKHGFVEVGRLPKAFRHPDAGFVDALVMYKWL